MSSNALLALYAMAMGDVFTLSSPSMSTFVDLHEPIPPRSLRDRFGHDDAFCKKVEKRRKRKKAARKSRQRNRR